MLLPSSWYLLGQKAYPPKASAMPPSSGTGDPGELVRATRTWASTTRARSGFAGRSIGTATRGARRSSISTWSTTTRGLLNGVALGSHEGYFQHWSVDAHARAAARLEPHRGQGLRTRPDVRHGAGVSGELAEDAEPDQGHLRLPRHPARGDEPSRPGAFDRGHLARGPRASVVGGRSRRGRRHASRRERSRPRVW